MTPSLEQMLIDANMDGLIVSLAVHPSGFTTVTVMQRLTDATVKNLRTEVARREVTGESIADVVARAITLAKENRGG